MRIVLPLLLLASALSLALGITLPLIEVERLFLLSREPSLVAIVQGLWSDGDRMLAAVVALFSIVLPLLKLTLLQVAAFDGRRAAARGMLHALARWSMLDVLLAALVIYAAKTSGLAEAFARPGLWFFATAAVLTALSSALIEREHARAPA